MIDKNNKTSLLVPYQFPEFIRDDPAYSKFLLFVEAYYQWMEENKNVLDRSKSLLTYRNIDETSEEFLQYFYNELLPYFPDAVVADKVKATKIASELYKAKGTEASYKFLFRILYDSDVEFFFTKEAVLKASGGNWYVPRSLKLSTEVFGIKTATYDGNTVTIETYIPNNVTPGDSIVITGLGADTFPPNGNWVANTYISETSFTYTINIQPTGTLTTDGAELYLSKGGVDKNFLHTDRLRLLGETSKSLATIDSSIITGTKVEVFISNIERLFNSGEYVRVVDNSNQDVLFDGQPLRAKIVGQIGQINIDPKNRGSYYAKGDPVIVYGGLNSPIGKGALAEIGTVTSGSITKIDVLNRGYGYRNYPNSSIVITDGGGAFAEVGTVDAVNSSLWSNLTNIVTDSIYLKAEFRDIQLGNSTNPVLYGFFANSNATIDCTLANAFSFAAFTVYPVSTVVVLNGGGGTYGKPKVSINSLYETDYQVSSTDADYYGNLSYLGILGPLSIQNGGTGYRANDRIDFVGGTGYGAFANVTSVSGTGAILSVEYVHDSGVPIPSYPLGGMGYTNASLPTLRVVSANTQASNAVITVLSILGVGAKLEPSTDRIGGITTINVLNYGEDYIAAPNVSLSVQDLVVSNVTIATAPKQGDIVYQQDANSVTKYLSTVYSTSLLYPTDPNLSDANSTYKLRVYDFAGLPNISLPILVKTRDDIAMNMISNYPLTTDQRYDSANGYISYGDGTAKATASFLNGLVIGQGQYVDTKGQLSSFDVIQNEDYNNFTYRITVEKEIEKYRKTLLNLVHPTGTKILGRYAMKANADFRHDSLSAFYNGYYLNTNLPEESQIKTTIKLSSDPSVPSNNIIKFTFTGSGSETVNISNVIFANVTTIRMYTANGDVISGEVIDTNRAANTITLKDNVWTTFANVAYAKGKAGSNLINILSLTGSYNVVNGGVYSNTQYPLRDIVRGNTDTIIIANNSPIAVNYVDYANNTIVLKTNLTSNANSLMSVNRSYTSNVNMFIHFGPIGEVYIFEVITEQSSAIITSEAKNSIII